MIVVLRRGHATRGRLGRALVLARTDGSVSPVEVDVRPGGDAVAAWRAYVRASGPRRRGNHRTFVLRLPQRASRLGLPPLDLSGAGRSSPWLHFVPGVGGPLLARRFGSGRPQSARWSGRSAAPLVGDFALSEFSDAAGSRQGRVLAAIQGRGRVRVALSEDAARSFAPAVTIDGSGPARSAPAVTIASTGYGAVTWAQRPDGPRPRAWWRDRRPAKVMASVLADDGSGPLPATTLATPRGAPSAPVIAAREDGGALIGWVETGRRERIADSTPGVLMVRAVDRAGATLDEAVRLGARGEAGRRLQLVQRGGRGATALWVTRSGVLRAQDLDPDGRLGRAFTLDRGVTWWTVRPARRGGAVAYLKSGRAWLVRRV